MSARAPRPPAEQSVSDLLDLTQELRALSTTASHVVGSADDGARVVLLTRDAAQRKWGERWLRQAGLQVAIPTDPQSDDALSACRAADVALVDVGLKNRQGGHLYRQLLHDGKAKPSVFALCANSRELADAVAAGPFDAARKPFNWEFLARRVARAATLARLRSQLEASESALKEALQFADKTRQQLRSNESVEPVTGLPNKAKFVQILQRALRPTLTSGNQLAVFVIGLTRFRLVVEAMGQSVANEMLARVGRNLAECLGVLGGSGTSPEGVQSAVLSSFDQSRFGLMLIWPGDDETLDAVRKKLLEVLHQPIEVPGQSLHLSACAGVALFPRDADSVDTLMQRADNAMRAAQSRGGGLRFYCPDSDAAAERKLKIEQMLSEALDQDELRVAYQPIVNVADDRVHAVEALLRWSRPDGTVIRPMEFVPVAEESGLMLRLGDFVLRQACKQAAAWHRAGIKTPTMCVNVAKVQLMEGDFVERVERILAETGLAPQYLELELSERGVLGGDGDVVSQLHALRALGVRLSLDDFGTGESAIGYLKELPIDVLKIDRSYVTDIVGNSRDAAIASAMVALGQGLGLEVIAEGVEEEGQLEALKRLSCNYYQGFLFGKAAPPEAVEKLLATTTSLTVQAGA